MVSYTSNKEQTKIQERIAEAIANGQDVYIVPDFDGTLSHFVDNPADARIAAEADLGLYTLSLHENVTITILTGREVAFMRNVMSDELGVVGSHGIEHEKADGTCEYHQFSDAEQSLIDTLKMQVRDLKTQHPNDITIEVDKRGCVSVKSPNPDILQHAITVMEEAESSTDNTMTSEGKTFVIARESNREVELRPNERLFGKAYGLETFIKPPKDALVVFLCDSLKENGTDRSAAAKVKERGENGIVIRVENGRVYPDNIPADATPDATYSSPAMLGMGLQQIALRVSGLELSAREPAF